MIAMLAVAVREADNQPMCVIAEDAITTSITGSCARDFTRVLALLMTDGLLREMQRSRA